MIAAEICLALWTSLYLVIKTTLFMFNFLKSSIVNPTLANIEKGVEGYLLHGVENANCNESMCLMNEEC